MNNNKIKKYFEIARKMAKIEPKAERQRQFKLGGVAIRKCGTIVISKNLPSRNPCKKAHVENRLASKGGKIIFVCRIDAYNNFTMAKPCRHCRKTMKDKNVKQCYYTISQVGKSFEYGVIDF